MSPNSIALPGQKIVDLGTGTGTLARGKVKLFDQELAALLQTNYPTSILQVHHRNGKAIAKTSQL
ncbi:MAG: hypothetical protein V7K48_15770 [Nostoc sp.]|uniref:hypothetical protein n=1 Tax=Nostoc sp. TaxID=1180 RepID=UPI002FFA0555